MSRTGVLVAAAALLLTIAPATAAPAAAAPRAALDSTRIVAGGSGVLTGHDFPASTTLRVTPGATSVQVPATVTTDPAGGLQIPYRAAADVAPGDAVSLTVATPGSTDFFFLARLDSGRPALDAGGPAPSFGQAGTIRLTATGFGAGEPLAVTCACTVAPATATTDATGAVTVDVRVAGPRRAPDLALGVTGGLTHRTASLPFTLRPATAAGPQIVGPMSSPSGVFSVDPTQGTLCVYETYGIASGPWWCSGVGRGGESHLTLQSDGNLVLRDSRGGALWQSRTVGAGAATTLTVQDDGNLVLRGSTGRALWASGTWLLRLQAGQTLRPRQVLAGFSVKTTMQPDGNLVQRDDDPNGGVGRALWSTRTRVAGSSLSLQTDGNLVVRAPSGAAVWSSRTNGRCPAPVLMQQYDLNLVLRSGTTGRACWASGVTAPP